MKQALAIIFFSILAGRSVNTNVLRSFHPGPIWLDNNGTPINAHGRGMLFYDNRYYWFGEHKIEGSIGNTAQVGVHVYSSSDLYNWVDEGIALKVNEQDSTSDIAKGCIYNTGLRNPDRFANAGVFSTGLFGGIDRQPAAAFDPESIIPGILTAPESFNQKLKVFYISVGEQDPRIEPAKRLIETFQSKGLNVEFASFPGGHEWQVWRKSLHDFAQKLFL